MSLNEKHIRELLGQTTDTELEVENLALAVLAPELAADWLRLRKELNELVENLNYTATCTGSGVSYLLGMAEEAEKVAKRLEKILNEGANN